MNSGQPRPERKNGDDQREVSVFSHPWALSPSGSSERCGSDPFREVCIESYPGIQRSFAGDKLRGRRAEHLSNIVELASGDDERVVRTGEVPGEINNKSISHDSWGIKRNRREEGVRRAHRTAPIVEMLIDDREAHAAWRGR